MRGPALVPSPEWSLKKARNGIAEPADIPVIPIKHRQCEPIFLLEYRTALFYFFVRQA